MTSETAQGKPFVSFISLIVRSYMLNGLSDYMRKNGFTLKKILLELDKIKCFAPNSAHSPRPLNPQTKTRREIYTSLALDTDECIGYHSILICDGEYQCLRIPRLPPPVRLGRLLQLSFHPYKPRFVFLQPLLANEKLYLLLFRRSSPGVEPIYFLNIS